MWMLDNICKVSDHASKSQSTEDIKLVLHALMLMQQPSACLMPNYKNTVHQPSKPMKISTTDNSGNWIYPVRTVSVLTSPLKRLASLQISKSPELCRRKVRSIIKVAFVFGTCGLCDALNLKNSGSNKEQEEVFHPMRNWSDKCKRHPVCSMKSCFLKLPEKVISENNIFKG